MQASDFGKVAVLLGGRSAEREVSLMSGNAVLDALRRQGVNAHAFDTGSHSLGEFAGERFDRAFIALHGRYGEDGTIQGALEIMQIPYTGSGVMACALAMDKWRTKLVWLSAGIPTPKFEVISPPCDWAGIAQTLGLPLIVKPAREGSTIGLTRVNQVSELASAYEAAAKYDSLVIAEQFISGQELTASVLDNQALPLIRIEAPGGNYDYDAKYFSNETRYLCPSGLTPELERRVQSICLDAFCILGCRGWGRVDVMLDSDNNPWLLEANTVPGMTGHSLVPMAAKAVGLSFDALVLRILESARVE